MDRPTPVPGLRGADGTADELSPYAPPDALLEEQPRPPGSATKAVVLGLVVDIGGTLVTTIVFSVLCSAYLVSVGTSGSEMRAALEKAFQHGWGFVAGTAMGCGFSLLGGYVCARISRRADYRLGYVLAALSAITGVLMGAGRVALLELLLLNGLTLASVLLGVRVGIRRVVRQGGQSARAAS